MKYSTPRPLPLTNGEFLNTTYSDFEISVIQKNIRKWSKPLSFKSVYYHITDEGNLDSILENGLLPNKIDGCVFMTHNVDKLEKYANTYKMNNTVILKINSLKLKSNKFRQSFVNETTKEDVVYLDVIKPEAIEIFEYKLSE